MSQTVESQIENASEGSASSRDDSAASSNAKPERLSSWKELITVPRWAVYCQAALLGLIATTFFVFGMMVGSLTSGASGVVNQVFDCRVRGSVVYREEGDLRADEGAVIFLLPKERAPDERSPGKRVSPESFEPLDNPAIDRIHELGGAVVRADENGNFDVLIDASYGNGLEYFVLIVSKNVRGVDTEPMTKEQVASVGTFFMPVEDVIQDRSYHWLSVTADGERIDLPEYEF